MCSKLDTYIFGQGYIIAMRGSWERRLYITNSTKNQNQHRTRIFPGSGLDEEMPRKRSH